jgi:hypothetical protein
MAATTLRQVGAVPMHVPLSGKPDIEPKSPI